LFPFWKRVAAEFKFAKKIYRAKYKLVFNLTEGDRGALLELISRDPKCIGWNQNETGYWEKKYLFHDLVNPNLSQKVG
jgi:ADP-heptose:LPS heptosyltransferase